MDRDEKLREVVMNDVELTEPKLKQLNKYFLLDNKRPELLSDLCNVISQIVEQPYALYKITVILKYLCDENPKGFSSLLSEQTGILKSLKSYAHVDNFGRDQGANIRTNVEQLLAFIKHENQISDQTITLGSIWSNNENLNHASDRLLHTLNSIDTINSKKILQRLRSDTAELNKFLPGPATLEKYAGLDLNPSIDGLMYGRLVEKMIEKFDDDFPTIETQLDPIIEKFIVVRGSTFLMLHEILIALTDALKKSKNPKVTKSLVIILEKLLQSEFLFSAITDICKPAEKGAMEKEELETKWQSTLQLIFSLPSRVANKLDGKVPDPFVPGIFAKIISVHIARSVKFLHRGLEKFRIEADLRMISILIGKALITLGSQRFEPLIDILSEWCSANPGDMRASIKKIFWHIDRTAMEPLAVLFLKRSDPAVGIVGAFESFMKNPHWKHVLTKKIPLVSYYENENVAKNLIGYLSSSRNEEPIFTDLLTKLLDVWGDRSALNHTSFEQHVYITKLILMSMKRIKGTLTIDEKERIRKLLFSGTAAHLESTQTELRAIGMVTGEIVIDALNDSENEPKLRYDYEGMPAGARKIVEELRNLEKIDDRSKNHCTKKAGAGKIEFDNEAERMIHELEMICGMASGDSIDQSNREKITDRQRYQEKIEYSKPPISRAETQDPDENLDSDDDLVPYDMSNDTPISEKLRPTYLRDLKENLLNRDSNADPNIFAESMRASEDLILSQLPNDDPSFAVELLEIFVTLREASCLEDFELLKYKACVAIVIVFPKESAKYLSEEFHTKVGQYSIKDRLFILDILGESARRLSKIETKNNLRSETTVSKNRQRKYNAKKMSLALDATDAKRHETLYDDDFEVLPDSKEASIDWQEIVAKRIESNTRRFAHPTKSSPTTANKFNDVASSFFYPLLYGFRREGTCMYNPPKGFDDQDNILLVNYLKALSRIMMAAENCIVAPKMGKEIMDLAWTLRYHNQAKVRCCVIENIASVIITLPKEGLTGELMELIFEFRSWLADVSDDGIRGDPDSECRNMGKNVVALIDSIFRTTITESL